MKSLLTDRDRETLELLALLAPKEPARAEEEQARIATFLEKYAYRPGDFIVDCMKFTGRGAKSDGPTPYQYEALNALTTEKRVSVRGPHGLGKTAMASWVVLWFAITRDLQGVDWKVPTTASAWRQLTKFLWPEIGKWSSRLKWDLIPRKPINRRFELLSLNLKLPTGEAFALTSNNATAIEGAHASALLYIFDEAKAIPDDIWNAAEGAFASPEDTEAYALAISTPGEPLGRFYEIHARQKGLEDWWARHVTVQEAIAAGRISEDWRANRERQWGADSPLYKNRVLGEFAAGGQDGVIPLGGVEGAVNRWLAWKDSGGVFLKIDALGVDIARGGGDLTVIALRADNIIVDFITYNTTDTMQVVGHVANLLKEHPGATAIIDVVGVGAGVYDRLRELKLNVQPFNAAEGTDRRDKSGVLEFSNKRAAGWWALREAFDSGELLIPDNDILIGDLVAPTWRVLSGGKVIVESKKEVKTRLKRSTDYADALVMACWKPRKRVYIG